MKKKTNKKVLVMAVVLALVIVVGGTFAWFTSKDEVTNKLTAQNDYGVSIVEDFTPPANWTPGQVVNKDVFVTNTGNVDAFVKVSLSNFMELTTLTASTGEYVQSDADKYIELSTTDKADGQPDTLPASKDEVKSIQAGGRLVCKADSAVTTEKEQIENGTEFTPNETGVYIFERDFELSGDSSSITTEYDGYYFVKGNETDDKYYAITDIEKNTQDVISYSYKMVEKSGPTNINGSNIMLDYTNVNSPNNLITATYTGSDGNADDIKININLVEGWENRWTCIDGVFYYNYVLSAGETSPQLIESLELADEVVNDAFYKFDYNLKLTADSIQVVIAENGQQTIEALKVWTEVAPTAGYDDREHPNNISSIGWKKANANQQP